MEVGPQGAASPPPTSSALVAAPLATENKVEIGNATACAEVVGQSDAFLSHLSHVLLPQQRPWIR